MRPDNPVRRPVARSYDAAVPELSAGLPGIPDLPWESLSHCQVLAQLTGAGWVPCRVGDWAVALRSPEGHVAARVCPFDPAYWAFVDLCRECAGNRWLPRIELADNLEGGGSVVFLEYVAPVDQPVVKDFAEQWQARDRDPEFAEISRAAQRIHVEHQKSTPWWGRCDLDDAHIHSAAGRPVLLDVFCMAGSDLYQAILDDVRLPSHQHQPPVALPCLRRIPSQRRQRGSPLRPPHAQQCRPHQRRLPTTDSAPQGDGPAQTRERAICRARHGWRTTGRAPKGPFRRRCFRPDHAQPGTLWRMPPRRCRGR